MRLFIAVNFTDEVKGKICEVADRLKLNAAQGKFVEPQHMHLTLEFLGEVPPDRVDQIKKILDGINFGQFTLSADKIGFFKRPEGKIYWLGLRENENLLTLQKSLHQGLLKCGFEVEDREYKPHITLGRNVVLKDGYNPAQIQIDQISIPVRSIDLMKSEFISGRLTHTLMFSRK